MLLQLLESIWELVETYGQDEFDNSPNFYTALAWQRKDYGLSTRPYAGSAGSSNEVEIYLDFEDLMKEEDMTPEERRIWLEKEDAIAKEALVELGGDGTG